jgi:DNA-binding transcriptional LysR family regulator
MNFTLHQLRIFLQIVQLGSVTKAAESLHLSQPAVSAQLKNLQNQFDIPLTEVVGRRIHITEFGRRVADSAERIVAETEAISFQANSFRGLLTGRLRFSIVSTGKYVMPFYLVDFMNEHPGINLQVDVTNKAMVIESLEANEVDFSLVSILPERLDTDGVSLLANELFLVGNAGREFPEPTYPAQILAELPLIYREAGSGTRATMERYLQQVDVPVQKKLELASNEAVKQAVLAGMGYSILPLIGLRDELENGTLQIIPVEGLPVTTTWHLIWMNRKQLSPAATYFLEYLEQQKLHITRMHFSWADRWRHPTP